MYLRLLELFWGRGQYTGSHYVALTGLKLREIYLPLPTCAGFKVVSCHAGPGLELLILLLLSPEC